jgi:hypothetical protein
VSETRTQAVAEAQVAEIRAACQAELLSTISQVFYAAGAELLDPEEGRWVEEAQKEFLARPPLSDAQILEILRKAGQEAAVAMMEDHARRLRQGG